MLPLVRSRAVILLIACSVGDAVVLAEMHPSISTTTDERADCLSAVATEDENDNWNAYENEERFLNFMQVRSSVSSLSSHSSAPVFKVAPQPLPLETPEAPEVVPTPSLGGPPDLEVHSTSGCIETPQAYAEAWGNFTRSCVAPTLFARLVDDQYPINSWYTKSGFLFVASHYDLEGFLLLNNVWGEGNATNKVLFGIAQTIGYGGDPTNVFSADRNYYLLIGDIQVHDVTPFVPSVLGIVSQLNSLGHRIPFHTARALSLAYSRLGQPVKELGPGSGNPAGVYAYTTGCSLTAANENKGGKNCSEEYDRAVNASKAPGHSTCVDAFFDTYEANMYDIHAADLRAFFEACLSCYPLWSASGLSWSDWASPYACTNREKQAKDRVDRFAGMELMVHAYPPMPVLNGSDVLVHLTNYVQTNDFSYLEDGFCQ